MKKVSLKRSTLVFGLALGGLLAAPSQSHAGPAQLLAIAKAINPAATATTADSIIKGASSATLSTAVINIIKTQTAANAALYVGEALKRSNDADFGTQLGGDIFAAGAAQLPKIFAATNNVNAAKDRTTFLTFVGASAKAAATGTAPNSEYLQDFAAKLISNDPDAYDAARFAIASKTAAGAIVGGRVSVNSSAQLTTDADKQTLVTKALLAKSTVTGGQGLGAAAQEIMRYVTGSINSANVTTFTQNILNTSVPNGTKPPTQPLLASIATIAPGAVAGSPLVANEILTGLFGNAAYDTLTKKVTGTPLALATVKNAAKLATGIGAVADTEQYSFLAGTFGDKIANKVLPSTTVVGIVKSLVTGMVKKPLPTGGVLLGQDRNNAANRADEVAEIAVYMLNALSGNAAGTGTAVGGLDLFKPGATPAKTTANAKAALALVNNIIKTAINSYTLKVGKVLTFDPQTVAADVAGSVALTLNSMQSKGLIDSSIYESIKASLLLPKSGIAINKLQATAVTAALTAGFAPNPQNNTRFEDGTNLALQIGGAGTGGITEPETDIRGI